MLYKFNIKENCNFNSREVAENKKVLSILYMSYTGLLEPLGQSQILAYLLGLAEHYSITLITVEKPKDLADTTRINEIALCCKKAGIEWISLTYHKRPRLLATAWDMCTLGWTAWKITRQHNEIAVHTRSYIPAFIALTLNRFIGLPFIFDMRAFWPDEMVTAGRLRQRSIVYKLLKALEHRCILNADIVVTLTQASARYLQSKRAYQNIRFEVIPTCADLNAFQPEAKVNYPLEKSSKSFVLGCIGTVTSGWFLLDRLMHLYKALLQFKPNAVLRIITRDNPKLITQTAQKHQVNSQYIEIFSRTYSQMPEEIRKFSAGAMFFVSDFSKLGSCPTRMAEILGCGIPCVANAGIGDVGEIIDCYQVGVLANDDQETTMHSATQRLLNLLEDPQTTERCRHAAEEWFSLEKGVQKYDAIYQELMQTSYS